MVEKNKYSSFAIGAAMSISLAAVPAFAASHNLFEVKPLKNGYLVAQADTKKAEPKMEKEGKCSKKMKEGKCSKDKNGHCSKEMKEGKCSKDKKDKHCGHMKKEEGKGEMKGGEKKCGSGTCGSKKKKEKIED